MKCLSCAAEFSPQHIEKKNGLVSPEVKCPICGFWLKKDGKLSAVSRCWSGTGYCWNVGS